MGSIWNIIILCCGIIFSWLVKSIYRQRNLPHGPIPIPFFGNIISLAHNTHTTLTKLADFYGPVFTIWFGTKPIVMVNDYNVALEVFSKNGLKFSARPNFISKVLTKNKTRLPFMNYSSRFIRNQNICRNACDVNEAYFESCMRNINQDFEIKMKSKLASNDFDPADDIASYVTTLMSQIIYGVDLGIKFSDINLPGDKNLMSIANTTNQFILLRLLNMSGYLRYKAFITKRDSICRDLFEKSLKNIDQASLSTMIVNVLNEHMKDVDVMESEILCSDLFIFGVEDLCAAFKWMLLYFITWPEIQIKVQEELDKMKTNPNEPNNEKYFTVDEAMSIPYLQAAVWETIRLSSLNPLSSLHATTDCVTLRGYKLPKDTCVCVNLNTIHHSFKYWDHPYEFNPSRFLDWTAKGEKLRDINSMKGFLPFGSGVRKCIADKLTMKILTSAMANLLYKFHFDVSPWNMKTGLSPHTTRLVLVPNSYLVSVSER